MTETHVVLARKYRSKQFSELVGQDLIVRTLVNSIRNKRLHHAYLFTGSRGIGKTSIARLFAKALRCENLRMDEPASDGKVSDRGVYACDVCPNCIEVTRGGGMDVIEIDGASNNGVDAIRDIRESARFLPTTGARRIFIVDEVHMLTTAAFNALLKTLEEPPEHVIFIFATTEPHKIPATILSRVQRFDFKQPSLLQIKNHLDQICLLEQIEADPGATTLIAKAAEGSIRDSLSLLDQVLALCGNHLTIDQTREGLGIIPRHLVIATLKHVFAGNALGTIQTTQEAFQAGHDMRFLAETIVETLHSIIVTKVMASTVRPGGVGSPIECTEEEWTEYVQLASMRPLEELELFFQVMHHGLEWIAKSSNSRNVLQVLLIKCAASETLVELDHEETSTSDNVTSTNRGNVNRPTGPLPQSQGITQAPKPDVQSFAQASSPSVSSMTSGAVDPSIEPATRNLADVLNKNYEFFVDYVKSKRPLLGSVLDHAIPSQFEKLTNGTDLTELVIKFRPEHQYYRDQLSTQTFQEQFRTFLKEVYGKTLPIRIETISLQQLAAESTSGFHDASTENAQAYSDGAANPAAKTISIEDEPLAVKREREDQEREKKILNDAYNHPLLKEARALFGSDLSPIQIKKKGHDAGV